MLIPTPGLNRVVLSHVCSGVDPVRPLVAHVALQPRLMRPFGAGEFFLSVFAGDDVKLI